MAFQNLWKWYLLGKLHFKTCGNGVYSVNCISKLVEVVFTR